METLRQRLAQLRDLAEDRWSAFRDQSGFYQLKAALLAGYLVVAALTLVVFIPRTVDFVLDVGRVPWGASERTFVDVLNQDGGDREEITVDVFGVTHEFDGNRRAGVWTAVVPRLAEGASHRLWPDDLTDEGGRRPSSDFEVERVRLRAGEDVIAVLKPAVP